MQPTGLPGGTRARVRKHFSGSRRKSFQNMPDWTAPFRIPKITNEEWARKKADYVAEHGYSITIPGLSDIIKVRTEEPMTALEHYHWKKKNWDYFSPKRLDECQKQKKKRRERYLAMLASPTRCLSERGIHNDCDRRRPGCN